MDIEKIKKFMYRYIEICPECRSPKIFTVCHNCGCKKTTTIRVIKIELVIIIIYLIFFLISEIQEIQKVPPIIFMCPITMPIGTCNQIIYEKIGKDIKNNKILQQVLKGEI
jgi:hypothetical protein